MSVGGSTTTLANPCLLDLLRLQPFRTPRAFSLANSLETNSTVKLGLFAQPLAHLTQGPSHINWYSGNVLLTLLLQSDRPSPTHQPNPRQQVPEEIDACFQVERSAYRRCLDDLFEAAQQVWRSVNLPLWSFLESVHPLPETRFTGVYFGPQRV